MSETYCGKSCSECMQREELSCPGCKEGPGRHFGGDCELAKCCTEKGHEECDTCGFRENCGTLQSRERQPEHRRWRKEAEEYQKEALARRAPVLGKWLWLLFWLIVPEALAGIMGSEYVMKGAPGVYMAGQLLNVVCSAVYGAILFKLSAEEERYRTAGICALISAAVSAVIAVLFGAAQAPTWSLLITLPGAVLSFVGEYHEYYGHADVLAGAQTELSERWLTLWKWYAGCMIGMIGSMLLVLISPILAVIVLLGVTVGSFVVSITKLVYLYRTAKVFRDYPVRSVSQAG